MKPSPSVDVDDRPPVDVEPERTGRQVIYRPGPASEPSVSAVDPGVGGPRPLTVHLSDYDVLPSRLGSAFDDCVHIEIDDPLSFPFEDAPRVFWETPLHISLPRIDFETCVALFDEVMLRRLTVCDRLDAPNELIEPLAARYGFPRSMFVEPGEGRDRRTFIVADRLATELQRRRSTLYSDPPIPAVEYKRRLMAVDSILRRAVDGVPVVGVRRVELHGWNVGRFVPAVWGDLTRVVERRAIAVERLGHDYPSDTLPRLHDRRAEVIGSAIGVGIDHLRIAGSDSIHRALSDLFNTVQSTGRLVLVETFGAKWSPDQFIDLLLDVSCHRLVLHDMHLLSGPGDRAATTAVFELTKIGQKV